MDEMKVPYLCGGVLFFLLTKAALPVGTARDHQAGLKDEHSEPILMQDLIYTFTGSKNYGAAKDTSKYKDCLIEGSSNVPFHDIAKCTIYDNTVTQNYDEALKRMDNFVDWHFDPEMKRWFVKALLEIIEYDSDILGDEAFFLTADGTPINKDEIKEMTNFDLSAFLIGVLHYVLNKRRGHNALGIATLDAIGQKKNRKPRTYTGNLGEAITRTINVSFLPERVHATIVDSTIEDASEDGLLPDKSDDEIINEAMTRTGKVLVSALGAINAPKINPETMAESLGVVAAAVKACTPDEIQKENLVRGVSTIATVLETQKHAMAERIRQNNKKADSSEDEPDNGASEPMDGESTSDSAAKGKTVVHQTIVNQYGDHPVHIDHVENLKL